LVYLPLQCLLLKNNSEKKSIKLFNKTCAWAGFRYCGTRHPGSRVRIQGHDSGLIFRIRIKGQDSGFAFRFRI